VQFKGAIDNARKLLFRCVATINLTERSGFERGLGFRLRRFQVLCQRGDLVPQRDDPLQLGLRDCLFGE